MTKQEILAQTATIKGMPRPMVVSILVDTLGAEWCSRIQDETDRQWARRLTRASGNLV